MLLALFACLVAALCVHVLTATVICAQNAVRDEKSGRALLAATDACLADLRGKAEVEWVVTPWESLGGVPVSGRLTEKNRSFDWTLSAEVRNLPSSALGSTSATVERGRDGIDLPRAAVVTSCVRSNASRTGEWLLRDGAATETAPTGAKAYLARVEGATVVGAGCLVESLDHEWRLDAGWRTFLETEGLQGSRVHVIDGSLGETVCLPVGTDLSAPEGPGMVVVTGGSELDLRNLGEVWAIVVVDDGSVLLDGTVVHGAVYATECVNVGECGQVVYSEDVWEWAHDRSLVRVRLLPGSRQEGTE